MIINNEYNFRVSLSKDAYINKEISGAMIGTTKNETNREIRKRYGFKSNQGVGFEEVEVTANSLLSDLTTGKVFCHLFTPTNVRKDGCFSSSQKCNDNFKGSYVIGVDIDHTNYKTAEEFVDMLEYKPTFYYTSYSNLQPNKGARFRLIYVFDEIITNPYYFRYCAYNLNKKIEADTNEVIDDDCNLRCSQYFNGTNKDNKDIVFSDGITNVIYSLSDFDISDLGYYEFLNNGCHYKTNTHKLEINRIKNELEISLGLRDIISTTYNLKMENDEIETEEAIEEEKDDRFELDERILNDFDRLDLEEFKKQRDWVNYLHTTKYIWRVEKDEWEHGTYQFVDDNYFRLFFYRDTQKDGSKRRRNLFERMCLRRIIKPTITAKELAFNAIVDIIRFYDNSDGLLNGDFIRRNVINALQTSNIDEVYKDTLAYLKAATRPKKGIIYKNRKAHTKQATYNILDDLYNFDKTVTENLELLEVLGFPIKKSTIYNYLKDRGVKTDNNKLTDEEVISYINLAETATWNYNNIKSLGFKIGNKKFYKIYKEYKNNALSASSSLITTTYNLKMENDELLLNDELEQILDGDTLTTEDIKSNIYCLVELRKQHQNNTIERRALNALPSNNTLDFSWL